MTIPQNLVTSLRQRSAAETLSTIGPLLHKYDILGFADHTPNASGLIRSIEIFRGNPRSGYLNLGKGFGLEAALTSGYMEAIEMATIEQAPEVPLFAATSLGDSALIYSAKRGALITLRELSHAPEREGSFVRGSDLLTERECYGPRDEHFVPPGAVLGDVGVSTNGLASGNTLAEARLHAVYELIERHVGWLSLQAFEGVRLLELQDVESPLSEAIAELTAVGLRCEFFQLGRLFDVRVVQCAISSAGSGAEHQPQVNFGWGAHHSLAIAASRAAGEAVQAYATRKACRTGALPDSRMRGGVMISAEALTSLRSDSSAGEHALLAALRRCQRKQALSFEDEDLPRAPDESLQRVAALMRLSNVSHLFSWTLSPADCPISVVRCVVPEFKTFASD